jgi:acetyl-CoA synthetase
MELINPLVRRWREDATHDPDGFWGRAAEALPWFRKWDKVFEWNYPTFKWFSGGLTNIAYNALDVHVQRGWGGHAALIYVTERGERRVFTYAQMWHEVKRLAAALRGMGVQQGDRVAIYMPTCPEAIALMLACLRIGAIHIVVFAGFGAGALADRINAAGARILFTSDLTYRKGKDVSLKGLVADALKAAPEVQHCVTLHRGAVGERASERDMTWDEFLAKGAGQSDAYVAMESNEPAYILATSGTTAKPKLAVHTHGGYQVHIHSMGQWVFGLKPTDVWWSTSDIGWVVGHSYIVYAPLIAGCTTIAYEGALDYPDAEMFWRVIEEFAVTGVFTSPTAARMLMRYGDEPPKQHNHSSLTRVFCAGEVLNAPAWEWLQRGVFKNRIPVIDHMWQTETGGPIFGNPWGLGMLPIKPGSATIPLPGIECAVVNPDGTPCAPNEKGIIVITRPFPGLTASLWGEPERYGRDYWERIPRMYYTGDSTHIDEDGYVWFAGRADEIIKIAGHRIGTIEVETAFLKNPAVAEAGVTARPDPVRMEVISAFVVLRAGHQPSEQLRKALLETVRNELGPIAVIGDLNFVNMLPKTRSGKIMRRVLKAVTLDKDPGDITTIEDEVSVSEARQAWEAMKAEIR